MIADVLSGQRQYAVVHSDVLAGLKSLPDGCVQVVVTSPPYFALRSYLKEDDPLKPLEMGSEKTPEEFCETMGWCGSTSATRMPVAGLAAWTIVPTISLVREEQFPEVRS